MIPSRCLAMATNEGDVVFDPFGGGGSTYEAEQRMKRYWIGTEIIDCSLIRERFRRNVPDFEPGLPMKLRRMFSHPDPKLRLKFTSKKKMTL